MRKVVFQLSAPLKWTRLHRASRCCALGCAKQGCARRSLFTVSRMSDSAAHSPRRGNSPCSMLMNMHPLNGLRTVLSPLPSSLTPHPTPCCPHLAPRCLPFDTSTRKHAGSQPPLHTEGDFYLTGRKIRPE